MILLKRDEPLQRRQPQKGHVAIEHEDAVGSALKEWLGLQHSVPGAQSLGLKHEPRAVTCPLA